MSQTETEQTVTMTGPPLSRRITIQEYGGGPRPPMNRDHHWLQVFGGEGLDVSLAVAQEAARLFNSGQRKVTVTVKGGLGAAIRSA